MPMNTKVVISMVLRTCSLRLPSSPYDEAVQLSANTPASKLMNRTTMNTRIGRILKIVTMRLMTAASRTPRAIRMWKSHTPTVDTATARNVAPSPKLSKNAPSVAPMKTQ